MLLATLLQDMPDLAAGVPPLELTGMAQHSAAVQPGYLFLALPSIDGKIVADKYVKDAIARGAAAVFLDTNNERHAWYYADGVPIIPIRFLARQVHQLANIWWSYPAQKLSILGVTGTNGKTSCTNFLAQSLNYLGARCGIIGTLGTGFLGQLTAINMTTPDVVTLYQALAQLGASGADYVALEVSSHALAQERISGLSFAGAMFTNLTHDHLDYHGSMVQYAAAKRRLFTDYPVAVAVLNTDDAYGLSLWSSLPGKVVAYGMQAPPPGAVLENRSYIYAQNCVFGSSGTSAQLITPEGDFLCVSPLVGQFNLSNIIGVACVLRHLGYEWPEIMAALAVLAPVPGRLQLYGGSGVRPRVVLDYAHSPDALMRILQEVRRYCEGQLYCVFGCGGERDPSKRAVMGEVAAAYADRVVITNDNPRREDPSAIVAGIMAGINNRAHVTVELERARAIATAINGAGVRDWVVVAGKGAETYQEIAGERLEFSDEWWIEHSLESYNVIDLE